MKRNEKSYKQAEESVLARVKELVSEAKYILITDAMDFKDFRLTEKEKFFDEGGWLELRFLNFQPEWTAVYKDMVEIFIHRKAKIYISLISAKEDAQKILDSYVKNGGDIFLAAGKAAEFELSIPDSCKTKTQKDALKLAIDWIYTYTQCKKRECQMVFENCTFCEYDNDDLILAFACGAMAREKNELIFPKDFQYTPKTTSIWSKNEMLEAFKKGFSSFSEYLPSDSY